MKPETYKKFQAPSFKKKKYVQKKSLSEPIGSLSRRQRQLRRIGITGVYSYYYPTRHKIFRWPLSIAGGIKGGLTVLISVLIIFTIVQAGTITPPSGTPAANFYSLSEIYDFITNNTAATEASPALDWSGALVGSGRTLTEIYSALASLIDATKVLTGTTYLGTAGTMANNGAFALTASSTDQSVTAGYYSGGTLAGDADLVTGNIKSGVNIFGVAGNSNVVDTSSGDAIAGNIATGTIAYVDGSALTGTFDPWTPQWLQTKDDWVNSGGTSGEYILEEATWTEVSGSPFTGNTSINYAGSGGDLDLDSGTVKQDARTGLWWSDVAAVAGTASTTDNVFTLSADGSRPTGGNAIGFCDALNTANFGGYNDWYLPTQKELQQAYIDGSANNLPNPGYFFWSSTELNNDTAYAWRVYLNFGYTFYNTKVTSNHVRCVRR